MSAHVLDRRALNRALLARQALLEREDTTPIELIERLAGLQTQNPTAGHLALWSRIDGYDPAPLDDLLERRRVVRLNLMRATKHLVTATDALAWRPLHAPVLHRAVQGGFHRELAGLDPDEVAAAILELSAAEPLPALELGRRLAERFPGRDANALGIAAAAWVGLVQPPPRGLWGRGGRALQLPLEHWLGRPVDPEPDVDALVLRYLGAFGPASVMDAQAWCGITRLRESFERLRPRLATFRGEDGRELFDLPDAPRPPAEVPAPVRLLPVFDNVSLAYADRSRVVTHEHRKTILLRGWIDDGFVLVDGFARATWRVHREKRAAARLVVTPFEDLGGADVEPEAAAFLAFVARGEAQLDVVVEPVG